MIYKGFKILLTKINNEYVYIKEICDFLQNLNTNYKETYINNVYHKNDIIKFVFSEKNKDYLKIEDCTFEHTDKCKVVDFYYENDFDGLSLFRITENYFEKDSLLKPYYYNKLVCYVNLVIRKYKINKLNESIFL